MKNARIIADRYEIEDSLGSGGMGVVLKARDTVLGITVAIKMLGKDRTGLGAARLQREATAAGKLNHQNIAKVLNFGQTEEGEPYMVMELLKGKSLSKLIEEKKTLSCVEAVPLFIQIAQALSYAHSHQIIHRDLKPSNIMLLPVEGANADYIVKVLDFGVAKFANEDQSLTHTGSLIGSPLYMSPEQAQGEDATIASEIYSFGCLMFEALTGETPFKGHSVIETLSMHRNVAAPLLTDLISVQKLPREMVELVDECLRKSPANRPQDFKSVQERLNSILLAIENKTLTREEKQRISNQHFKLKIFHFWKSKFGALVALVVVAGLFGLGFIIFKSEQERIYKSKPITTKDTTILWNLHDPASQGHKVAEDVKSFIATEGVRIENRHQSGLTLYSDDAGDDEEMAKGKGKPIVNVYCNCISFDGSGLRYLNKDTVHDVSFDNSVFNPVNIKYLKEMKNLKKLHIGSPNINDESLKEIATIKTLEELILVSNDITDKGFEHLKALPHLRVLNVTSKKLTDEAVSHILQMKKLVTLRIVDATLNPGVGKKLAKLKNLQSLSLINFAAFSDESAEALKMLNITNLALDGAVLEDGVLKSLSEMKVLKYLTLGKSKFNVSSIVSLYKSTSLASLDFTGNSNITDDLIFNLHVLHPNVLNFDHTNINDKQMSKFLHNRMLSRLLVHDTNVTREGAQTFRENYKRIWNREVQVVD